MTEVSLRIEGTVEKLDVHAGDTLLVKLSGALAPDVMVDMRLELQRMFPGVHVLITDNTVELQVVPAVGEIEEDWVPRASVHPDTEGDGPDPGKPIEEGPGRTSKWGR